MIDGQAGHEKPGPPSCAFSTGLASGRTSCCQRRAQPATNASVCLSLSDWSAASILPL